MGRRAQARGPSRTLHEVSDHAAPPTSDPVLVEVAAGIARVRMHRPERRNALGLDVLTALIEAMADVGSRDDVQVVILGGDGPAFSAGHDIAEMVDGDEAYYRELFSTCTTLMNLLRQLSQPVIAQVDGVATAAGCQLVAGCDLAVASERATFATPGVRIGLFCSTPLVPISRAVGTKRALEMLLTGEPIDAPTALAWGLVNRVVPAEQLQTAVNELAAVLLQWSPQIVGLGKLSFYEQLGLSERSAYEVMTEVMTANAMLPDAQEGFQAFVAKRSPVWGR
jgi:enoyl-CoA hydratase/carnithine racemase